MGFCGRAFTAPVEAAGTGVVEERAGVGAAVAAAAAAAEPGAWTVMVGGGGAPADILGVV